MLRVQSELHRDIIKLMHLTNFCALLEPLAHTGDLRIQTTNSLVSVSFYSCLHYFAFLGFTLFAVTVDQLSTDGK